MKNCDLAMKFSAPKVQSDQFENLSSGKWVRRKKIWRWIWSSEYKWTTWTDSESVEGVRVQEDEAKDENRCLRSAQIVHIPHNDGWVHQDR